MHRQLISSGAAFEERVGYSRAVRVGNTVYVAGTAPIMPDEGDPPDDAYGQAQICLERIRWSLEQAGATLEHVVRTTIFVTDATHIDQIGRAHKEAFATVRPACTAVVAQLLDPRWLVEIEVDAVIPEEQG